MSIVFGHPTGNPNSHNAALAYLEAGMLECFCVPWMPSGPTMRVLNLIPSLGSITQRLGRRYFPGLEASPRVQGRVGEFWRLLVRASGLGDRCCEQANHWLMRTMTQECRRSGVTAVHAYEDCSLWQFKEAKRLGKTCIYDMPTCYYPEWERIEAELGTKYSEWLPARAFSTTRHVEQKRQEMELADLTLIPSSYVEKTIREFYPQKAICRIPYGVDAEFWRPGPTNKTSGPLRFIYAGRVSVQKGIPLLMEAWSKAALRDAQLELIGSWVLAEDKRRSLPAHIRYAPPCSSVTLRDRYRNSDIFIFPSFAEGLALVLLEAMACGLPVVASEASGAPEVMVDNCGMVAPTGDLDALVELLRWFSQHRDEIPAMGRAARVRAERCTWKNYRVLVTQAVSKCS